MAKKKRRGRREMTIPLAPVLGLAAGLASSRTGPSPIKYLMDGNYEYAIAAAAQNYLGYDPIKGKFDVNYLQAGLIPLILGGVIHKYVGGSPLNVNRVLAAAGVPLIRI